MRGVNRLSLLTREQAVVHPPLTAWRTHGVLLMPKTRWGDWSYDKKRCVLMYRPKDYNVDLKECRNSAEVLNWVLEVNDKNWMTPEGLWDFVQAITALLNPQLNICSAGVDKVVDPCALVKSRGYN